MKIHQLETYKVIEADLHISIVPANAEVTGANNLIIASAPNIVKYLERYLWERCAGAEMKVAHELALKNAIIIKSMKA